MADHDASPPSTPPAPSRPPRSGGAGHPLDTRHAPQETFFDDGTPVDSLKRGNMDLLSEQLRDSHDLSLHDSTRDSVVDNMLLSLDQFSCAPSSATPAALYPKFDDDNLFPTDNPLPPPTRPSRLRGHTYASSHSSDFDLHPDDTSSRYSGHHSRGRRSNSSNNIPTTMSRKGSLRAYPALRDKQANVPFGDLHQTSHSRGAGKKGSKSSTSSSMDFGHAGILGTHRLGLGNRSASFDHGSVADHFRNAPLKAESILNRGRPTYQPYDDYDAAPEPTIPAGPRRVQEQPPQSPVSYPPQPSYAPPQAPIPRRKNSMRSTTSRTLRKNKSQPEPNMRLQAQEFVNASTLRDMPLMPTYQDPPAPSPTVAMRKHAPQSPATPVPAPREKPGFFRRLFGGDAAKNQPQLSTSSANSNHSYSDASPASVHHRKIDNSTTRSHVRPQTTPSNSNHIVSQLKSVPPVPQTARSSQKELPPAQPTLAKKHSSFFRRRKKSLSENTKPPIMSLDFRPPQKPDPIPPQPSPGVSSLRKVMNPYFAGLGDDEANGQAGHEERWAEGELGQGFSLGYKPHKDATVRSVQPASRGSNNTSPSSRGDQVKLQHDSMASSPKMKLKMKHGKRTPAHTHDDSFLADSSSCNEDRSGRATPENRHERQAINRQKPTILLKPPSKDAGKPKPASASASTSEVEDDGWIVTAPTRNEQGSIKESSSTSASKSKRVWLEPTASEDELEETDRMALPLEGARTSQKSLDKTSPTSAMAATTPSSDSDVFHSATSLPVLHVESRDSDNMPAMVEHDSLYEARPTDSDRERALRIFNGDEPAIPKSQAAAVLGDLTLTSTRLRKAYMELFDWSGFNILAAMRDLCGKLVLKAETQQVDRILMSLSERWCECNPSHGFKATDVVHTICYSVLLLNTDLHLADIESRMTRSQFVRNTLPTVVRVCKESIKDNAEETLRPQSTGMRRGSLPWNDKSEPNSPSIETTTFITDAADDPLENRRARSRLSIRPPIRSGSDGPDLATPEANVLVNASYNGPMKGWENQIETVLKEFYNSIRQRRLPLHGSSTLQVQEQPSSNSLSVGGMLRRTPSVLSKAPSENTSYRGRSQTDFRSVGNRWVSKTRSRPRLYPSSTVASSRTSLDDGSVWSPAGSSSWSRYSFGKTGTSMSMESLGSHFAHGDYQQAIGFANALSQAIIREEGMTITSNEEFTRVAPLLEDETLELAGAPWAKEGILKHKHHLESLDKKAKDRTWNECFAVIEKGYMRLFSFNMNAKSLRHKNKSRPSAGSVVGGGNWMDNAEALDSFLLRQSIASALPPPGYSKNRPHVFALSLPTGAVHLFQVGTPDIVREFVSTANYWSARLSKEPLVGGVSNIEYGWGENVINPALIRRDSNPPAPGHVPRPSMASSLRSSVDHATGAPKARLPGDKITLSDWSPPTQSMMASNLMEIDQLRALTDYVKNVEDELAHHNELRAPMLIAFSPRHPNASKAMSNWERKSSYLLREIVKFRTYIDSLTAAQVQKDKIYAAREADEAKNADGDVSIQQTLSQAAEIDGANQVTKASAPSSVTA